MKNHKSFGAIIAAGALALTLAIPASAGSVTVTASNPQYYYLYTYGNTSGSYRQITPNCWGFANHAPAGSWVKMTWKDNNNFVNGWTASWDIKDKPKDGAVIAWPHVSQFGTPFPKKCDSNMKSQFVFNTTLVSSSGTSERTLNLQSYGSIDPSGKLNTVGKTGMDIMIRPNSPSTSGTLVTLDGTQWRKEVGENTARRKTTIYRRVTPSKNVTVNVKPFMVDGGYNGWYLGTMQIGWEVYRGAASYKVNNMNIKP